MLRDFVIARPLDAGPASPELEAAAARAAGLHIERAYEVSLPSGGYQVTYFETEVDFASTARALGFTGAAPELIGEWDDPAITKHRQGLGFAFPLRPGAADALREFGDEAFRHRRYEHHVSRRALGLTRERLFRCASPAGDLAAFYIEGDHPRGSCDSFAASAAVHDVWLRGRYRELLADGYDLDSPLPPIRTLRDRELAPIPV